MQDTVSPRDLAAAIGVSESSLKRWVDGGALTAARTAGGHRRIAVAEAVRFIRSRGVPLLRPERLGLRGVRPLRRASGEPEVGEALYEALRQDDRAAVRSLILSPFLAGHAIATICDGPVRHALTRIGELWHHDTGGIVVEHRATDCCLQVLRQLRGMLPPAPPGAPVAIGGAPAGDPYLLPSLMVAAVLAEQGFRDVNLGADVPTAALRRAVRDESPRLVWWAMSAPLDPASARQAVAAVLKELPAGATLVVGGRGVDAAAVRGLEPVQLLTSMAELTAFVRGLRSRGGRR